MNSAAFPVAVLAPHLALGLGLFAALLAGMGRVGERPLRVLVVAALGAALALVWAWHRTQTGGPLIRSDEFSWLGQLLCYGGAIPLALVLSGGDISAALLLGSALGMGLLAVSGNLLMLFIGLQFMSLPGYVLVSRQGRPRSYEGAVKYFFAGGTASALFLMGLALHYADTRSLALEAGSGVLSEAGLALMGAAALFKIGCVPMHFWLPDVYESSSPELAGFFSTSMKAAGFLLLMRLVALGPDSALAGSLPALGALTMIFGAILALRQQGLQRLFAYSSISHAGNLILGVGAWAAQGARAAGAAPVFFYLAVYLLMSNGVFQFLRASSAVSRGDLRGLGQRDPSQAAAASALLLSLAGIPPTGGFLAKFLIFWELVKAGLYGALAVAGLATLVSLGYYLGLVRDMVFEEGDRLDRARQASLSRSLVWVCAAGALMLGLGPSLVSALARALGGGG
ncbi:MAG: hypothetical protein HY549_01150 [Elusimicrobia bacterium]|nr:hypothetical protein [Elusimicrobiota bacterium]